MVASAYAGFYVPREDGIVHCGTTQDATLSDCETLLYNDGVWNAAWAGNTNVCQ